MVMASNSIRNAGTAANHPFFGNDYKREAGRQPLPMPYQQVITDDFNGQLLQRISELLDTDRLRA